MYFYSSLDMSEELTGILQIPKEQLYIMERMDDHKEGLGKGAFAEVDAGIWTHDDESGQTVTQKVAVKVSTLLGHIQYGNNKSF